MKRRSIGGFVLSAAFIQLGGGEMKMAQENKLMKISVMTQ